MKLVLIALAVSLAVPALAARCPRVARAAVYLNPVSAPAPAYAPSVYDEAQAAAYRERIWDDQTYRRAEAWRTLKADPRLAYDVMYGPGSYARHIDQPKHPF